MICVQSHEIMKINYSLLHKSPPKLLTCEKYSSAILKAHSLHSFSGLAGFAMSAHLMSILLRMATFSGVLGGRSERAIMSGLASPEGEREK